MAAIGLALAAPPRASADVTVAIAAPADGSTHAAPFTGPVTVTFTGVTGASYGIQLTGPDSYQWSTTTTPATDGSYDFAPAAADNAGAYTVTVADQSAAILAQATFTVTKANAAIVVSPQPGSDQPPGFAGPASISWQSVSNVGHTYDVTVSGPGGAVATCSYPGSGLEGTTTDCSTGALAPGSYTIAVRDDTTSQQITSSTFRVLAPPPAPLRFLGATISARGFYPLRRDGYRDAVYVTFITNLNAHVTITIRTRRGRIVRRVRLGTLRGEARHSWRWAGRLRHGSAPPGRYTIRISARRGAHVVHARSLRVRVRTGWQTRRGVRALYGRQFTLIQKAGNCAHRFHGHDLLMACVGRGAIVATYRFRLPRSTTMVRGYKGRFLYALYVGSRRRVVAARGWRDRRTFEIKVGISQRTGRTGVIVVGTALTYLYRVRV